MKTAMQHMVDWLDTIKVDQSIISTQSVLMYANELLEKEKQQIKRAYNFGDADAYSTNTDDWAEQYYNETFNQQP